MDPPRLLGENGIRLRGPLLNLLLRVFLRAIASSRSCQIVHDNREGSKMIRRSALLLAAFGLVLVSHTRAADDAKRPDNTPPEGFVAVFNGKDLSGWKGLPKSPLDNPFKRAEAPKEELAKAQAEADQ